MSVLYETVDNTAIRVNLSHPPILPTNGAKIRHNVGGGWVIVRKHSDGLYVDDRKVSLLKNSGEGITGLEFFTVAQLAGIPAHPNILDALAECSQLIPDEYKYGEQGGYVSIYFFGVMFACHLGHSVRRLAWNGHTWTRGFHWLYYKISGNIFALIY